MSDPQKADAAQAGRRARRPNTVCSTRSSRKAGLARDPAARERGKNLVKEFVAQVLEGAMTVSKDAEAMINARIAQIDHLVSIQLNEVLHHPDFQKLEGSWRGLKYLIDQSETSDKLKIKVLNVTKKELLRDLQRAPEFDQSALFKKVTKKSSASSAALRSARWSATTNSAADRKTSNCWRRSPRWRPRRMRRSCRRRLRKCSTWTASRNIDAPRDMAKIFDTTEYAKWKSFRQSEDSRYVGLCLPHMLMRLPYGKNGVAVDAFNYEEGVDGTDHSKYLWGNAAYALGARLTKAFAHYGWCAAIRGVEGGGLVEGLPTHNFTTDAGDVALKCPTEVADHGPSREGTGGPRVRAAGALQGDRLRGVLQRAVLPEGQAVRQGMPPTPTRGFRRSLPYILAVSRFAHYLKAMMRDKIGSFMSRKECEAFLNTWILQYVVGNDDVSAEVKARRPLREARIEVVEVPGKPGAYRAVAFLKPHFQLDELSVSLRLVADLPQSAK